MPRYLTAIPALTGVTAGAAPHHSSLYIRIRTRRRRPDTCTPPRSERHEGSEPAEPFKCVAAALGRPVRTLSSNWSLILFFLLQSRVGVILIVNSSLALTIIY